MNIVAEGRKKELAQLIRHLTPPSIRRAVAKVGSYLTADIRESIAFPSIELALRTLHDLGFRPRITVDVGAYQGTWTRLYKSIFPDAVVLMVEAQEGKRGILEKVASEFGGSVSYRSALLAAEENRIVPFYEMETGSSVFQETSPYPRVSVAKSTRTLDGLLSESSFLPVDMIKLDVQGSELEVLKGAPVALAQAQVILLEASLIPVNVGCPPFEEVIQFMAQNHFRLFDFCSQTRRNDGVLWQTDLLFLRADSRFAPRPELNKANWQ